MTFKFIWNGLNTWVSRHTIIHTSSTGMDEVLSMQMPTQVVTDTGVWFKTSFAKTYRVESHSEHPASVVALDLCLLLGKRVGWGICHPLSGEVAHMTSDFSWSSCYLPTNQMDLANETLPHNCRHTHTHTHTHTWLFVSGTFLSSLGQCKIRSWSPSSVWERHVNAHLWCITMLFD